MPMTSFWILSPLAITLLCGIVQSIHALSEQAPRQISRRTFVASTIPPTAIATTAMLAPLQFQWIAPQAAMAQSQQEELTSSTSPIAATIPETEFRRTTSEFGYTFVPPSNFEMGNKPLKTHLDEINFNSVATKGYQFGITVDPVRINTLKEVRLPSYEHPNSFVNKINRHPSIWVNRRLTSLTLFFLGLGL
jgi:hypothetical protein